MLFAVGDELDCRDSAYTILSVVHTGESELYRALRSHDNSEVVLKFGDAAMDEAIVIAALRQEGDPKLIPYLPEYLHLVTCDGKQGSVFRPLDGFFSLEDVKQQYPAGIEPQDMAWMFRRLLVPLGFINHLGYTHCAVLPRHVMIHPEQHGLVLVDWSHAVHVDDGEAGVRIGEFEKWYPPDIDQPSAATDTFMAANLMSWLMGGDPEVLMFPDVPREMRSFLSACTKRSWRERPQDPHAVLEYFDTTIERLWGKRKFRPFDMATP